MSSNTSPWAKIDSAPVETMNFAEIMSEEYAHKVQESEIKRYEKKKHVDNIDDEAHCLSYADAAQHATKCEKTSEAAEEWEDYSSLLETCSSADKSQEQELPTAVLSLLESEAEALGSDSDALIAQMLQSQFDYEYNQELKRIEDKRNKQSKVTVTLDKFRRHGDMEFLNDPIDPYNDEEDELAREARDWDRFETNEKLFDTIPKCGFRVDKEGEMITKHDPKICGVRNACRVMSFPPEFQTGDAASFEMSLSNQVYNQLKTYSRICNSGSGKKNKMHDRKANIATAEMGVDAATRLLLYKMINNQILEQVNGIISTGKEALILHATSDPSYTGSANDVEKAAQHGLHVPLHLLPKECAIKIFKTTLNEFKQRDRYIKDDYRFRDRFSKNNARTVINMWAEKEMHNMMRMQSVGINCPDVILLKKHVLVMSFIGANHNAAPKLKDARLSDSELSMAYEEIVSAMFKLYNEAKLVHADLSEYNILWHEGKCFFIDVAQSVEPKHPSALEFLMRDCNNIINFFSKRGLPNIFTKEQLFEHITSLNANTHNAAMLERIHTRGASVVQATAPNQDECPDELKPLSYPFDLAWEKSQQERAKNTAVLDDAANALQILNIKCSSEESQKQQVNGKTAIGAGAKSQ